MTGKIITFVLACTWLLPVSAKVEVYPAPPEMPASDQYKIEIIQDGKVYSPHVYFTAAQLPKFNLSKTTAYTIFAFDGTVEVHVTRLSGDFGACTILPTNLQINAVKKGNSISFKLDEPVNIAVEFDGDITHPLLLFSSAPETNIPEPDDPGVLYFEPGYHTNRDTIVPQAGQTIYLSGGSVVEALIIAHNTPDVTIRGPGILLGRKFGHTGGRHIYFTGEGSTGITVRDITIVDAPGFYITTRASDTHVKNVKGIGWWFNTDGVSTGENGLIEDCFFKCNDDAIKLYRSGTEVYRTTIWQMENGAPFQISWNMQSDNSGFIVKDCDIIHCDHHWDNTNTAVFDAIHGGGGHMSNYWFEDIRIENCDWRLVSIQVRPNKFSRNDRLGSISNLYFKNISVNTPSGKPLKRINLIQGFDPKHKVANVVFENLEVNGKKVRNSAEGKFECCPVTTSNIVFQVTEVPGSGSVDAADTGPDNTPPTYKKGAGKGKKNEKFFSWENPIRDGLNSYGQHHFHIYPENGRYYLVATEHPNLEWGKRGIILYVSEDLKHWQEEAYLINRNCVPNDAWYRDEWRAPEIHYIDGRYYLGFHGRNDRLNPYGKVGFGLAVADAVEGPYTILTPDEPLFEGDNTNLFEDEDGKVFATWDLDGRFYSAIIDPATATLLSEPEETLGPDTMGKDYRYLDSPFLMKKDGLYYLFSTSFYSGYVVRFRYLVGDHPQGPWEFEHPQPLMEFLEAEAEDKLQMPWSKSHPFPPPTQVVFQNQVFKGPGGKYYMAYHSSEKYSEPYLVIEPLVFKNDGRIVLPGYKQKEQEVKLR